MFVSIPLYFYSSINGIKSQSSLTCFRAPSLSYEEGALGGETERPGGRVMVIAGYSCLLSGGDHRVDAHLDELVHQLFPGRSTVPESEVHDLDG